MSLQQTEPVVISLAQGVRFSLMVDGSVPPNAPNSQVVLQSEGASRVTLLRSLHHWLLRHHVVVLQSTPATWDEVHKALHHLLQRNVAHPDSAPEYVYSPPFYLAFSY